MPLFEEDLDSEHDNALIEEAYARTRQYRKNAGGKIKELLNEYKIVWKTFVEVHLEKEFYWWISRGAVDDLVQIGKVKPFRMVGRPSVNEKRLPAFYYDAKMNKSKLKKKVEEASLLWSKLTNPSAYGIPNFTRWAEDLVLKMFTDNGGSLIKRPIPRLDKKAGGDNDFLVQYRGLHYSIEVKNKFQSLDLGKDIRSKFAVARANDNEFLLVPRYLNSRHTFQEVIDKGGFVLMYKRMAFPPQAESFVEELNAWGLPASVWESMPKSVWKRFKKGIHPKAAKKRISKISKSIKRGKKSSKRKRKPFSYTSPI